MEKKKIITETQEKRCRMIGIAGSNTGVGCTHFSIMLTNYLAGYLRRKAILLEFNESGDLEKLEYVCTGQMGQKNPYRVLDADYYKYAGPEAVKEVLQRGYDDILIDFGSVKDGANELYWRCDKKFLVGSFTEWQQESFREFEMEQRAKQKKKLAESRGIWKRGDQKRILEKISDQCRTDSVFSGRLLGHEGVRGIFSAYPVKMT